MRFKITALPFLALVLALFPAAPARAQGSSGPITSQPQSQTINPGSTVVFTVVASAGATYQWQLNGANLTDTSSSATSDQVVGSQTSQLMLTDCGTNSDALNGDSFTCNVTVSGTTTASSAAVLTVPSTPSSNPGTLTALSARAFVGTGADAAIGGLYISGNTSCTVLILAIGPGLGPDYQNLSGLGSAYLGHDTADTDNTSPVMNLTLYAQPNGVSTATAIASNESITGGSNASVITAAAQEVYTSTDFAPGDTGILISIPPSGPYSAIGYSGTSAIAYTAIVTSVADNASGAAAQGVVVLSIYQLP